MTPASAVRSGTPANRRSRAACAARSSIESKLRSSSALSSTSAGDPGSACSGSPAPFASRAASEAERPASMCRRIESHPLDIRLGVQPQATRRPLGRHEAVAELPGAQQLRALADATAELSDAKPPGLRHRLMVPDLDAYLTKAIHKLYSRPRDHHLPPRGPRSSCTVSRPATHVRSRRSTPATARDLQLAGRTTRSPRLAEEATQEAFLNLWRSALAFDIERGTLQTWLLTMVHNRSIDCLRREGRHTTPSRLDDAPPHRLEARTGPTSRSCSATRRPAPAGS